MTTTVKVLEVGGDVFALMMLYAFGALFVVAAGTYFAFRYWKISQAAQ